ncbi:MAG TPA: class I SAM-dependent methyltransferase, partial [Ilumatobacter sp.]|nr:class I SAM-dependent methyltransferase [Ilumatobacter sp.]
MKFLSDRLHEQQVSLLYPDDYRPYAPDDMRQAIAPAPSLVIRALARGPLYRMASLVQRVLEKRWPDRLGTELRIVYRAPQPGFQLLDFGCGSPSFLNEARQGGWQTIGADFNLQVVDAVRAAGHQGEVVDDAFWPRFPDSSVHRVRMNHVLEHLYDPLRTLTEIRRVLHPDGILHIAVPNPASFGSWIFRSRWFDLDCPRHVVFFSPKHLCTLLREVGWEEVHLVHQLETRV